MAHKSSFFLFSNQENPEGIRALYIKRGLLIPIKKEVVETSEDLIRKAGLAFAAIKAAEAKEENIPKKGMHSKPRKAAQIEAAWAQRSVEKKLAQ